MLRDSTTIIPASIGHSSRYLLLILTTVTLMATACSTSKTVSPPQTTETIEIDGDLSDWPHGEALLKEGNYFDYYAMYDSSKLYVYLNLKSAQYLQLVENAGLTMYISAEKKNRKAFGITYPVGAYNFLKQMPGTYQKFKQDPKWGRKPSNQKLLEKLRRDNYEQAMISQRENKEETPQEVVIALSRLEAQGVEIAHEKLHNRLQLELSIPLAGSATQQFAVRPQKDQPIQLGFTVNPPEKQWDQGSTTVDLSQRSPYRDPYGRRRGNQQMEQRLSQLKDAHDAWFSLEFPSSFK